MKLHLDQIEPKLRARIEAQMAKEDGKTWFVPDFNNPEPEAKPAKRVRQSKGPNKLERDFEAYLRTRFPNAVIRAQAIKLKLCNGSFYKPDVLMVGAGKWWAFECKGGSKMKGVAKGILALKVAAAQWPEIQFVLVWKDDGKWMDQVILP